MSIAPVVHPVAAIRTNRRFDRNGTWLGLRGQLQLKNEQKQKNRGLALSN